MRDRYESPLCERYASARMQYIFSPDFKFTSWRKMWLYLAEAEKELGLDITDEQLDEIRAHLNDVDYDAAAAYEKRLRHDVMAHLRAFADQCPKAGPILHLGATSCYVGDNTDVWQLSEALKSLRGQLLGVMAALSDFALKNADVPTLAYTHFQGGGGGVFGGVWGGLSFFALFTALVPRGVNPFFGGPPPTRVGMGATLWLQVFLMDFYRLTF